MKLEQMPGGVTAPEGFQASGVAAHIKSKSGKKDVAILYSMSPATAAGVFTTNQYAAAPVEWCRKINRRGHAQAIVVNSGNANACTGEEGAQNAAQMAKWAATALGLKARDCFVCSTGVIGVQLPMDRIQAGILAAAKALHSEGGSDAAQAIMTTDTFAKEIAFSFTLGGKKVKIGGISKGSGMIHPNMATMLGFITTDAAISAGALKKALKTVADRTFNMLSVDGDTSTNDSLICLANGLAHNAEIRNEADPLYADFLAALEAVCLALTRMMAKDGEGATKLLEAKIVNARNEKEARKIAKAVIGSSLVKAAFFGEDANWGRIICAVGYSGAKYNPQKVDIYLRSAAGCEAMMQDGSALVFDEENAAKILAEPEIEICIDMKDGQAAATAWGCDLTYDYVKINGSYRT